MLTSLHAACAGCEIEMTPFTVELAIQLVVLPGTLLVVFALVALGLARYNR